MATVVDVNGWFQESIYDPIPSGVSKIFVEGETVRAALDHLFVQYPGMRNALFFEDETQIRWCVHLYLNENELRTERELQTLLHDSDVIKIVPVVA